MNSKGERMIRLTKAAAGFALCVALAGLALPDDAVAEGPVEIHGYGNQNYLRSRDLPYNGADERRDSLDERTFALVFAAPLGDRSKAWAQIHMTEERVRLDWAFVEHAFGANVTGRAGKIKLPVGFYNEIIDVKFLQLSTERPFVYQEALGITAESFQGVALRLDHTLTGTAVAWDLYAGQAISTDDEPFRRPQRLFGGRVELKPPVAGLRLMGSAYRNDFLDGDSASVQIAESQTTWLLSAEYKTEAVDLKSEYGASKLGATRLNTGYLQGGYRIAARWMPFVRYERLVTDKSQRSDPAYFQRATVIGMNFAPVDGVAVRIERQFNRGYALPVARNDVNPGEGRPRWNMLQASVSFIF
jgi:hypothetical protein